MMKILILIIAIFAICNAVDLREDIVEKINQLSAFRNQMNEAKEAFTRFYEVATHTHNGHMEIVKSIENNKERQARIASPQCLAAYANLTVFLGANSTCSVSLAAYFNTQTSSADKKTAVSNFCTNCQANFVAALKNVISVCNVSDVEQKVIISAGFYPRFLCAQADGQFCSNVINDVIAQVPTNIGDLKDDLLVKICSPCVTLALNVLQQGNQALTGPFDLYFRSVLTLRGVCVKLSGKFCFSQLRDNFNTLIQIGAKFNSSNSDINSSDFQKILQFFCSPCYRLVSTRLAISNGVPALTALKDFKAVGSLCRKNAAREFCVVKIFDLAKPIIAAGATGGKLPCDNSFNGSNGTCSDDCKNYIKNFVNKGGCCWSVLVDAISGVGPGADSNVKQAFIKAIKSCVPDINLPEPCPSVAKATITITYTNIIVSAQIQSAFIQAVLADIRVAIGGYDSANEAGITVTNNKRANSVTVTVPDVQTSGTAGEGLNYSETACNSVCALVPIADPSADVTVSSRTTGYTVQSSSSVLTFSFALLFILSLFFF